jgi:type II secretion system protein I
LIQYFAGHRSNGFSLLEVIIAFAIFGVAVVTIFQLFSINLRSIRKADDHTKALIYSKSLLDEAYSVADPSESSTTVEFEKDFDGSREVTLKAFSEDEKTKLYEIAVTVTWPPSGRLKLTGLRTIYENE